MSTHVLFASKYMRIHLAMLRVPTQTKLEFTSLTVYTTIYIVS